MYEELLYRFEFHEQSQTLTDSGSQTNKMLLIEVRNPSLGLYINREISMNPDSIIRSHHMPSPMQLQLEIQLPGTIEFECPESNHLITTFLHSLNHEELTNLFEKLHETEETYAKEKPEIKEGVQAVYLSVDIQIVDSVCVS